MSINYPYLPSVKINYEEDTISIPFIDGSKQCIFLCKEDWTIEDFLKNNGCDTPESPYTRFEIWGKTEENSIEIEIYEITDNINNEYFLITDADFIYDDFSMPFTAVCLPKNGFCLLRFYIENLLPFSDKNFLIN